MAAVFKRILVTGSTGFLGHHLMPRLREAFPAAELVGVGSRHGAQFVGEGDRIHPQGRRVGGAGVARRCGPVAPLPG